MLPTTTALEGSCAQEKKYPVVLPYVKGASEQLTRVFRSDWRKSSVGSEVSKHEHMNGPEHRGSLDS